MIPVPNGRTLSIVSLPLLVAAIAACQVRTEEDQVAENDSEPVLNLPAVPLPEPPLDRKMLLTAVAEAASAKATGEDDSEAQRLLDGRRFEFRIRFGCRGPVQEFADAAFGWAWDSEQRTLRVRATPTITSENEVVRQVAGEDVEDVEGFWIPRPWLLSATCPAGAAIRTAAQRQPAQAEAAPGQPSSGSRPAPAATSGSRASAAPTERQPDDPQETQAPPPAYPRVGIGRFFTEEDPRSRRRSAKPYEFVRNLEPDNQVSSQGFDLVLSGRLKAMPGKGVIHCVPQGADLPPNCIVSADIDRVRLERPDTREMLAEWGSS